jgi:hypothetical protein
VAHISHINNKELAAITSSPHQQQTAHAHQQQVAHINNKYLTSTKITHINNKEIFLWKKKCFVPQA